MNRSFFSRPEIASLLFAGASFVLFFLLFTPRYDTNDDVRMLLIASGKGLALAPDAHILYSHIAIGELLSFLYGRFPAIPWYGLYLTSIHFLGWTFISYAFVKYRKMNLTRWVWLGSLFLLWELPQLLFLQYTSAAFTLALGGILVLVTQRNWGAVLAGTAAICLASMVRLPAAGLAGLISLPLCLYFLGKGTENEGDNSFGLQNYFNLSSIFFLIAICLSFVFFLTNRSTYLTEEEWKDFARLDAMRSVVTDYDRVPYTPQTSEFYQSLGWSRTSFDLYRSWFVADTLAFQRQDLEAITRAGSWRIPGTGEAARRFFGAVQPNFFPFLLLLPLLLLLPFFPAQQSWYLVFLATLLILAGILAYLILFRWLHPRISYPLAGYLLLLAGWPSFTNESFSFSLRKLSWQVEARKQLFFALILAFSLIWTSAMLYRNRMDLHRADALKQAWQQLTPTDEDLFVVWADSFPYEYLVLPWQEEHILMNRTHLLSTGLTFYTPYYTAMARAHGIANLHEGLLLPGVFLVAREEFLPLYQQFFLEQYGEKRYFQPVFSSPETGLWVWKVITWEF